MCIMCIHVCPVELISVSKSLTVRFFSVVARHVPSAALMVPVALYSTCENWRRHRYRWWMVLDGIG